MLLHLRLCPSHVTSILQSPLAGLDHLALAGSLSRLQLGLVLSDAAHDQLLTIVFILGRATREMQVLNLIDFGLQLLDQLVVEVFIKFGSTRSWSGWLALPLGPVGLELEALRLAYRW